MTNWTDQRTWEAVHVGDAVPSVEFPLSLYRLVMAAGSNRDFNPIHHNIEVARETGAPSAYANNIFLQGMWERTVREYVGLAGTIRALRGFRMRRFNTVDDTVTVHGQVVDKWLEDDTGIVTIRMWSQNAQGTSVGPGEVEVTLPRKDALQ